MEHMLATGAVHIGGFAEQDFLNVYYKVSRQARHLTREVSRLRGI